MKKCTREMEIRLSQEISSDLLKKLLDNNTEVIPSHSLVLVRTLTYSLYALKGVLIKDPDRFKGFLKDIVDLISQSVENHNPDEALIDLIAKGTIQ